MEAFQSMRGSSWRILLACAIGAVAFYVVMLPTRAAAVCGDGVVDGDEECDDGGICTGGTNAGQPCTAETDCIGNGVCADGAKNATGCAGDSDCPGGTCVHCKTFGGDGCAANCTTEADIVLNFLPGHVSGGVLAPGSSGAMVYGSITVPLPLTGQEILAVGKQRNGRIPGVIKADRVNLPRIQVGNIGCACVRAVAAKTCGGTLFEVDGITLSTDCTDDYTAGASVCPADKPCAFVHGRGNAASGVIGCQGLDAVDVTYVQDCNGTPGGAPSNPVISFSGAGGSGSALLLTSVAVGTIFQSCSDDDPRDSRGRPATLPATTGTASAKVLNAFDMPGEDNGPFTGSGQPFDCTAVENHFVEEASLVGAFTLCDQPSVGDAAVVNAFVAGPSGSPLPTHTATAPPTATPTVTPTPSVTDTPTVTPPVCVGDCNKDGAVTVDELLTMVNVALGNTTVTSCPPGDANHDGEITVDEILQAVNHALNGCGVG
jgi:hypothetical protein